MFWDSLRLLSLKGLNTPGLFRARPTGSLIGRTSDRVQLSISSSGSSCGSNSSDSSDSACESRPDTGGIGSSRMALLCKRLYDSGQDAFKVLPSATKDVHAVAGILKLWLQSLPEAVIPPQLYEAALATQCGGCPQQEQVAALHVLLRKCEHGVLQVLYPVMELLHHYCLNQRNPGAERAALARLFGPVVLRPAGRSVIAATDDGGLGAQCVEHMIREYRTMFVVRKVAFVPPPNETTPSSSSFKPSSDEALPAGLAPLRVKPESVASVAAVHPHSPEHQAHCEAPPSSPSRDVVPDLQLQAAVSELLSISTSALFGTMLPSNCQKHQGNQQQAEEVKKGDFLYSVSPVSFLGSSPLSAGSLSDHLLSPKSFSGQPAAVGRSQAPQLSPTSVTCSWAAMSDDDDEENNDSSSPRDSAIPGPTINMGSEGASAGGAVAAGYTSQWLPHQIGQPNISSIANRAIMDARDTLISGGITKVDSLLQAPSTQILYFGPTAATERMTAAAQLAVEKTAVKRQLRRLERVFQSTTGRAPDREEKEALRPLYSRYWCLKRALAVATAADPAALSTAIMMES